jgi:hypothetical protein
MRCTPSARRDSGGARSQRMSFLSVSNLLLRATVIAAAILSFAAHPAGAQARRAAPQQERASSLRMGDTTITGERPTPDIFFIVPTGKGGNLQSPHRRDYSSEILEPVVKPWLEKDQNVSLVAVQHVASGSSDWKKALSSVERVPPPPPPAPAPLEPVRPAYRPAPEIPAAALSRPPLPAAPPPERFAPPPPPPVRPAPVAAAPPPPPPSPPPPAAAPPPRPAPAYDSVPILVPPQ